MSNKVTRKRAETAMIVWLKASNEQNQLESDLAQALAEVKQQFEPDINACIEKINASTDVVQKYADDNWEDLAQDDAKSTTFFGGTIGYRKGRKALKLIGDTSWEKVKAKVKKMLPDCIKVKEDLDKTALINLANTEAKKLERIGIEVDQPEKFYIKLTT